MTIHSRGRIGGVSSGRLLNGVSNTGTLRAIVNFIRRVLGRLRRELRALPALAHRPANQLVYLRQKLRRPPKPVPPSCRIFTYDSARLPNPQLVDFETGSAEEGEKVPYMSIGYPAWNLLYYSLFCSLDRNGEEPVVIETGTNLGFSTIVLAQAIEDAGVGGLVHTVEFSPYLVERSRRNVAAAGLSERVRFYTGDSIEVLRRVVPELKRLDFAFLDSDHASERVYGEFRLLFPKLVASHGKVYFDNTRAGGVHEGLWHIRRAFGGNMVHFDECSWSPPGACIWQPR